MTSTPVLDAGIEVLSSKAPKLPDFLPQIILPDGDGKGGSYDPGLHGPQQCIVDAVSAGSTSIAIAKPVQDGGSLIAFAIMLWRVVGLGQTAILAYPTLSAARDAYTKKLAPMLVAMDKMPRSGGGSGGAASSVVQVPGGGSIITRSAGGRHESGQASATGDILIPDEVDDWPNMRRIRLIEQRITKSSDPLIVYISTVKRDGGLGEESNILRLYAAGTQTRMEYPCPHCGEWQTLEWERVDVESAKIACLSCGAMLDEAERLAMLRKWRRKDGQRSDRFSILWTSLDSPFPIVINARKTPVLRALCDEFTEARKYADSGDHGMMRQFYRDRLCRQYRGDQQIDEDGKETPHTHRTLAARSERTAWAEVVENSDDDKRWSRYTAASIPAAVTLATGAIDVQRNRLYCGLTGLDADRRTYDLAWSIERARSGQDGKEPPPWSAGELQETLARAADYLEEIAGPLFRVGVVDVSDGVTQGEVAEWLSARPKWNAIQGEDHLPAIRPGGTIQPRTSLVCWDTSWRSGMGSYRVVTEAAQQVVAEGYRIDPAAPGAGLLPGPIRAGNTYLRHLTAVGWVTTSAGRRVWKALPGAGRADYFDVRAYATAVALAIRQQDAEPPPKSDARMSNLLNDPFLRRLG